MLGKPLRVATAIPNEEVQVTVEVWRESNIIPIRIEGLGRCCVDLCLKLDGCGASDLMAALGAALAEIGWTEEAEDGQ